MAKILLGVSILLSLLTAVLGYMTQTKVNGLQDDLKSTKSSLSSTTASLNSTKATLKKTEEDLTTTRATVEEREKTIAQQKGDVDRMSAELKTATAQVEEKSKALADIQAQLDNLKNIPGLPGGMKPEDVGPTIAKLQANAAQLENERNELRQVQETLNQRMKESEDNLTAANRQVQEYKQEFVRKGLSGKVLAYNPNWNFVVLSIGDRAGIKANAQMLVTRGGQQIARVRVTSVEPQTSIADVVPGTLARGESVQPGDTVIYEGRR